MVRKEQHALDIPLGRRKRKRTIRNWMHYQEPGSDWLTSAPSPDIATGTPDNWVGGFNFQFFSRFGPMQIALGNDAQDRPHVRVRRSHKPGNWAEFIWLGGQTITPVATQNDKRVRWTGWRQNTALIYTVSGNKLTKIIRLTDPTHPAFFRFALQLPDGHSYTLSPQGRIRIRDDQGSQYMRTSPPSALDSSTLSSDTPDGQQLISVTIEEDGVTAQGFPIFKLTPDANDLSAAVYPVDIDPTVTIDSADDIEDTYNRSVDPDHNLGGNSTLAFETFLGSPVNITLMRVKNFPDGNYESLVLTTHNNATGGAGTLGIYPIKSANADWVVGTSVFAIEAGASCWNWKKYNTDAWAGGANGCGVPGVDFDNTDGFTFNPAVNLNDFTSYTLSADWVNNNILQTCGIVAYMVSNNASSWRSTFIGPPLAPSITAEYSESGPTNATRFLPILNTKIS